MLHQAIETAVLQMLAVGGHRFPSPVTHSAETGGRGKGVGSNVFWDPTDFEASNTIETGDVIKFGVTEPLGCIMHH
jgi:hypothetical protein